MSVKEQFIQYAGETLQNSLELEKCRIPVTHWT